jgi:hypothetical protein
MYRPNPLARKGMISADWHLTITNGRDLPRATSADLDGSYDLDDVTWRGCIVY